jgi:hypothetical protein
MPASVQDFQKDVQDLLKLVMTEEGYCDTYKSTSDVTVEEQEEIKNHVAETFAWVLPM